MEGWSSGPGWQNAIPEVWKTRAQHTVLALYQCSVASSACLHSKGRLRDLRQIVNHPQISAMIRAQDEDVLSYMTDLQVEKLDHSTDGCQMLFCFRKNPYFSNAVIMKEYHLSLTGYRATCSSKIKWFWDDEVQAPFPTEDTISLSFFDWLCDQNWPGSDRIAEIIIEDLWLNPLKYYPRRRQLERKRRGGQGSLSPPPTLRPAEVH